MGKVILDKDGFATETGEITIFHFNEKTGEYLSSSEFYILIGSGIPAHSTIISPIEVSNNEVAVFDGGGWQSAEDHRGETVYSTSNLASSVVDYIGVIKDGFIAATPSTSYDEWKDDVWVTNQEKQKTALTGEATAKRDLLRAKADDSVVPLQDAVDLDEATDAEVALLKKWKQYRVALNRLDLSTAPDITWPEIPTV